MQIPSNNNAYWGCLLLLSSLCCFTAAATLQCPTDVIYLESVAPPTLITLKVGNSYLLGPGLFVLANTGEVAADEVLCVTGQDRSGVPAGVTRLVSPLSPLGDNSTQLHFTQYGGLLQVGNLQLQGRAGSSSSGGGGVLIKRSKDGSDDGQAATFVAKLVTFKSNSPRAVANDDDTTASLTFANCAFIDNVYDTWGCDENRGWFCYFLGPPGAAGVTTASNVTFKGSTVFRRNSWGALYAASPVTVTFEGSLLVADNTKQPAYRNAMAFDDLTSTDGAGLFASGAAHLLFLGAAVFRNNTGAGGCGLALRGAKATFQSSRTVQFLANRGSYGPAINSYNASIAFNGPVLVTGNTALWGAGGALYLEFSDVTFNAAATVYNNTLNGCTVDFDDGCAGGAMWIQGSHVTHNELATYQSNVARASSFGGAVAIFPYAFGSKQANSSFTANKMVAFIGNEGPIGGAIYTESDVTFAAGAQFISNSATAQDGSGGVVHVCGNSTLAFGGPVTFRNNSASRGGAVTITPGAWWPNATTTRMVFSGSSSSSSCWMGNTATTAAGGAALRIEAYGSALFGTTAPHNFGSNLAGSGNSAVEQDITVLDKGWFTCNSRSFAGSFSIEGNVCAARCAGKAVCKCPFGQVFVPVQCSCQRIAAASPSPKPSTSPKPSPSPKPCGL
uniref:Right handed beta helix domain-containing protein n=1 Tax=Tetradesmus obliquus TaxID=3088 RepID=A0A383VSW0_TETOB|eukprot:jgi/Sobl393_1/16432/SZX67814.1